MNKIKSIYKKNEEVTRLLVIMAVWLIFMAFTQARKFYTGMNFLTMGGTVPGIRPYGSGRYVMHDHRRY